MQPLKATTETWCCGSIAKSESEDGAKHRVGQCLQVVGEKSVIVVVWSDYLDLRSRHSRMCRPHC
jgi:hypothetical protein